MMTVIALMTIKEHFFRKAAGRGSNLQFDEFNECRILFTSFSSGAQTADWLVLKYWCNLRILLWKKVANAFESSSAEQIWGSLFDKLNFRNLPTIWYSFLVSSLHVLMLERIKIFLELYSRLLNLAHCSLKASLWDNNFDFFQSLSNFRHNFLAFFRSTLYQGKVVRIWIRSLR